ncbi:hypothetical protein ACTA71_002843 [Dictyostelium dimigraforme]
MKKYIISYGNNYGYYHSNKQINILNDTKKEVLFECYLNPKNRKCNLYKYNSNNPNNNKFDSNDKNFNIQDCFSINEPELKDDLLFKMEKENFLSLHTKHIILNKQNQFVSTMERKANIFSHCKYSLTMANGQQYLINKPKSKINSGGFEIYDGNILIGNFHFNCSWLEVDYELFLNEEYDEPFFLLVSIIANNIYSASTPKRKLGPRNSMNNLGMNNMCMNNIGLGNFGCDSGSSSSFGCDSFGGGFGGLGGDTSGFGCGSGSSFSC